MQATDDDADNEEVQDDDNEDVANDDEAASATDGAEQEHEIDEDDPDNN